MEQAYKEKVAIKILDKTKLDQKTQRLLSREISSMEMLHHPNVIRLYEVVETLSKLHLVMEYAGGGELFTKISTEGRLSDTDSRIVFSQILSAVKHMHDRSIIHRDLKAENVFYTCNTCVKVGDFGFSTISKKEETLNTFCGSPPYAAPELFRDENYVGVFVDVWALGILLFFMVTGTMPFRADTVAKLKKCILDGTYTIPPYILEPCQRLIRGILQPVPANRYTIDHIMTSEWLHSVQFPKAMEPFKLDPMYLAEPCDLKEEEVEVKVALENLGITEEHIRNNQGKDSRSSITGVYRIILHRVQKRLARESVPIITQLELKDSKKERHKPYREIRQTRDNRNKMTVLRTQYISPTCSSGTMKVTHDRSIIHRDLKAENVFYTCNTCVKVGDFGFSTISKKEETLNTFCGSPPYAAPELFRDENYVGVFVDVWALGILLFFMVTGTMPFRADTVAKLKKCILDGTYTIPPYILEPCQRLIRGILQPVPANRYTIDHIMTSEWLHSVQFPKAMEPFKLDPMYLAEPCDLKEEEVEVKVALENLGITEEHIRNNQGKDSRSSITGVYRIILHRVQKRLARESVPIITQLELKDSKKERHKPYQKVAIKILDKTKLDQKTQRLLSREISSMEMLHHPNVIRLYEVVETLSKLHLVMEYAGGGELFTKISTEGRLSDTDSRIVFSQILSAVKHMVFRLFPWEQLCRAK
ncbi:Serine/threonine-protein kinase NIM1 [Acipenser ruthenus]|uniref:non-specific serine/threonine protein kinase n=1 Tax=Acipenser ruthenus TaxID=7906 RepID=A0A444V7X8_ACIRT|nr:Serine/threonine-protein kinase NIM1 [Acipenser ruthenus]